MLTRFEVDGSLFMKPGDFGVQVNGSKQVLVPVELRDRLLATSNLRTVEQFYNYVQSFPSRVLAYLEDWSLEDVQIATAKLKQQLTGIVDDSLLNPPPRPAFVGGVLPPSMWHETGPLPIAPSWRWWHWFCPWTWLALARPSRAIGQ